MTGDERRQAIIELLSLSDRPLNGTQLADRLGVSRQVIVTDMALIRANGVDIISTNRGYRIADGGENEDVKSKPRRVYKVCHSDDDVETEMNAIVDMGGEIEDVFIYHKTYGLIKAPMGIRTRRDVKKYMSTIAEGKSTFLKNATSGYHYHTVTAESEEILDDIMEELKRLNFLAELTDYEPEEIYA